MVRIFFIRHAESMSNETQGHTPSWQTLKVTKCTEKNPDITDLGKDQAHRVSDYLFKKISLNNCTMYHSHLTRTKNTALGIYDNKESWIERNDLYEWIPSIESIDRIQERIDKFLRFLREKHQTDSNPVIVVGHSMFLSAMLTIMVSGEFEKLTFELPNCSITSVEMTDDHWAIYQVGKTDHLMECATSVHGIEKPREYKARTDKLDNTLSELIDIYKFNVTNATNEKCDNYDELNDDEYPKYIETYEDKLWNTLSKYRKCKFLDEDMDEYWDRLTESEKLKLHDKYNNI
jgi:broad specificity phosphatase PhoE